jgi:hypothetical protein
VDGYETPLSDRADIPAISRPGRQCRIADIHSHRVEEATPDFADGPVITIATPRSIDSVAELFPVLDSYRHNRRWAAQGQLVHGRVELQVHVLKSHKSPVKRAIARRAVADTPNFSYYTDNPVTMNEQIYIGSATLRHQGAGLLITPVPVANPDRRRNADQADDRRTH